MDIGDFYTALSVIQSHGYWIMFFVMIIEGPVITAAAGFAASLGIFNFYVVLGLSLLGNIVGDAIYFFIGKIGRMTVIDRYFKKFGLKRDKIKKIESSLRKHPGKAIALIKIIPPLPTPGLVLAGAANMPMKKFFLYSFIVSFFYSLFFSILGFYIGVAFDSISKYTKFMGYSILGLIILIAIGWWLYKRISKKIYNKLEKNNLN